MGQIYLVRHGQASFGAKDYDALSPQGVEQSRLLGEWFARCGYTFTRAVSGSLRRHRQTAEACLAALPASLKPAGDYEIDEALNEYDHEELLSRYRPDPAEAEVTRKAIAQSGNPRRAFQLHFMAAMARWMSGEHDADYRESWPAFRHRCLGALRRVVESAGSSQSVLVFTSGGPIAAICQELLGVPDHKAADLNSALVNSAVTRLLYQPGRVSLSYLNNFAHLEVAGPQAVTYR